MGPGTPASADAVLEAGALDPARQRFQQLLLVEALGDQLLLVVDGAVLVDDADEDLGPAQIDPDRLAGHRRRPFRRRSAGRR